MKKNVRICVVLLCVATVSIAQQHGPVEPASPVVGGLAKLSVVLTGEAFRSPDELVFELTDGLSLVEYKTVPAAGGMQLFVTLRVLKAGRQGILAIAAIRAGKKVRTDVNIMFSVAGTVSIQGTWELPQSIFQYEPCFAKLKLAQAVSDMVYNLVLAELQKRYTCVLLEDKSFLLVPDTELVLPDLAITIPASSAAEVVSTVLTIPGAAAKTIELPAGTQWVGSNVPAFRLEGGGSCLNGESMTFHIVIEGPGIPLGLSRLRVHIKNNVETRDAQVSFSKASVRIENGVIISRLEGTLELLFDTEGTHALSVDPILVFRTSARKNVVVQAPAVLVSVSAKPLQHFEKDKLQAIISAPTSSRWRLLSKTYAHEPELLNEAKNLKLVPWSKEYAARIALALSVGDIPYAHYELLRAERDFMPGVMQKKYPLLYAGTRGVYSLPSPLFFAPVLVLGLALGVLLIVSGKKSGRQLKPAFFVVLCFCLIFFVLLLFSTVERFPDYGITTKTVVRKVPDPDATVLAVCEEGTVVKLLSVAGAWAYTETGTQRGWIEREHIAYALK